MNDNKANTNLNTIASEESISKTIEHLNSNGFNAIRVENSDKALEKIKELIPENVTIMNGTSATLKEIGFIDLLKTNDHKWINLHEKVLSENDPGKQAKLRKEATISDYYLGSAHAVTENGEMLIASNTGSQLPHLVYNSDNIILVIGAQKIVKNLDEAFKRLNEVVIPLEDERMKSVYGIGTTHAKTLILHKENPFMGRKINVIIVKEKLGY